MFRFNHVVVAVVMFAVTGVTVPAFGQLDNAPSYRGGPNSATFVFNFLAPGGDTAVFDDQSSYPISNAVTANAFKNDNDGRYYTFQLPNFIDSEPFKLMRVQINYAGNPSGPAINLTQLGGFDPEQPVLDLDTTLPAAIPNLDTDSGYIYAARDFTIYPNPDWEQIQLEMPQGLSFDDDVWNVIIDTQSIPEPASAALLGLAAFAMIRRR